MNETQILSTELVIDPSGGERGYRTFSAEGKKAERQVFELIERLGKLHAELGKSGAAAQKAAPKINNRAPQDAEQKLRKYIRQQEIAARIVEKHGVSAKAAGRAVRAFGDDLDRAEREAGQYAVKIDRAERELKELAAAQRRANQSMSLGQRVAADLAKRVIALTVAYLGLQAIVRQTGAAFRDSLDYGNELTKLETLAGVNAELVAKWRKELLDLGPAARTGVSELVPALFAITSGGTRGAEALEDLTDAARAQAIGLGDAADIARLATAAYQAYGREAFVAVTPVDILGKTAEQGSFVVSELADKLGRAIPIAAAMGVEFSELGGSVASFTRFGVNADIAVTGIVALLSQLQSPSEGAKKVFLEIGTSAGELKRRIADDGLAPTLVDLLAKLESVGVGAEEVIPNIRALAPALATAGIQGEEYVKIANDIATAQGFINDRFEQTADDPIDQFKVLAAQAESLRVVIGDQLVGAIQAGLLPAMEESVRNTRQWIQDNEELIAGIGRLVGTALGTLVRLLGSAVDNWQLLAAAAVAIKWPAIAAVIKTVTASIVAQTVALRTWMVSFNGVATLLVLTGAAAIYASNTYRDHLVAAMEAAAASSVDFRHRQEELSAAIESGNRVLIEAQIATYTAQAAEAAADLAAATVQVDEARQRLLSTEGTNETPGWLQAIFGSSDSITDAREELELLTAARGDAVARDREAQAALEALRAALENVRKKHSQTNDSLTHLEQSQKDFLRSLRESNEELRHQARDTAALAGAQKHGPRAVADLTSELDIQRQVRAKLAEAERIGIANNKEFQRQLGLYEQRLRNAAEAEKQLAGEQTLKRLSDAIRIEKELLKVVEAGPAAVEARRRELEREAEILEATANATKDQVANIRAELERLHALEDRNRRAGIIQAIQQEIEELGRLTAARARGHQAYQDEETALRIQTQLVEDAAQGINILSTSYLALVAAREAWRRAAADEQYLANLRENNAQLAKEVEIIERFGVSSRQTALEITVLRRQMEAGAKAGSKLADEIRKATEVEFSLLDRIAGAEQLEQAAQDIGTILGGAFQELAETGRLNFESMWDSFAQLGFEAIEAIIQKWLAAKFADKSVSLTGSGDGGLGGGGLEGLAVFAAIATTVLSLFDGASKRRRARQYGIGFGVSQGPLGLSGTVSEVSEAAASRTEMQQAANAVRETINDLRISLGAFAAELPSMSVSVRNDGKSFALTVAGVMAGTFDSMEEAINHGLQLVLANADFEGLGERTAQALELQSRIGTEAFLELLPVLAEMDAVAEGGTAAMGRHLLAWRQRLTALDVEAESLRQLGIAEEDIIAARRREIATMVEQLRQTGLSIAGVSSLGAGLAEFLAQAEAAKKALAEEPARAAAVPDRPTPSPVGVGGGSSGGSRDPLSQAPEVGAGLGHLSQGMSAVDRATKGLGESLQGLGVTTDRAETGASSLADAIVEIDDSAPGATAVVQGLAEAFIEMVADVVRLQARGDAFSQLLDFQEQYGVQLVDNDKLRRQLAEIEFEVAKRRLQLTLLDLVANAQLYELTRAQVAQYQRWAAEIGDLELPGLPQGRRGGGGGGRRAEREREADETARAAETFASAVHKMEAELAGATPAARDYAEQVANLTEQARQGKIPAEDLGHALSMMAELHMQEVAADYREAALQFGEADIGTQVRQAQERFDEALASILAGAADNPQALADARRSLEAGLAAELQGAGQAALEALGGTSAALAQARLEETRTIEFLLGNLDLLGLTLQQVAEAVREGQLPKLLDIIEAQARRVGDEEALEEIQRRRQEFELAFERLRFESAVALLEMVGAIDEELQSLIDRGRELFDLPTADTEDEERSATRKAVVDQLTELVDRGLSPGLAALRRWNREQRELRRQIEETAESEAERAAGLRLLEEENRRQRAAAVASIISEIEALARAAGVELPVEQAQQWAEIQFRLAQATLLVALASEDMRAAFAELGLDIGALHSFVTGLEFSPSGAGGDEKGPPGPAAPDVRSQAGRRAARERREREGSAPGGVEDDPAPIQTRADIIDRLTRKAMTEAERLHQQWLDIQAEIEATAGTEQERIDALRLAEADYHRERLAGLRNLFEELTGQQADHGRGGVQGFRAAEAAFATAVASGDEQAIDRAARDLLEAAGSFEEGAARRSAEDLAQRVILEALGPILGAGLGAPQPENLLPPPALGSGQLAKLPVGPGPLARLPAAQAPIVVQAPGLGQLTTKLDGIESRLAALERPLLDTASATSLTAQRLRPMEDLAVDLRRKGI